MMRMELRMDIPLADSFNPDRAVVVNANPRPTTALLMPAVLKTGCTIATVFLTDIILAQLISISLTTIVDF